MGTRSLHTLQNDITLFFSGFWYQGLNSWSCTSQAGTCAAEQNPQPDTFFLVLVPVITLRTTHLPGRHLCRSAKSLALSLYFFVGDTKPSSVHIAWFLVLETKPGFSTQIDVRTFYFSFETVSSIIMLPRLRFNAWSFASTSQRARTPSMPLYAWLSHISFITSSANGHEGFFTAQHFEVVLLKTGTYASV